MNLNSFHQKSLRLTLLASTIAALSAPAFAAPTLEVYGKINVTLQSSEVEGGVTNGVENANTVDQWEVKSNASRFGLKGELTIDEEFAAFYQLEWEVDTTEGGNGSGTTNIKSRNQVIGLKGGFGKLFAGRHDTPFKMAQNKIDLFNDLDGDMKAIFGGEARASNMAQYSPPKWGGFGFNVATLLQEKPDTATSTSDDSQDGLFDATSISLEWSNKDLYLALALDSDHDTGTYNDGYSATRLVGQYTLGNWQFGAMWQDSDESATVDTNKDGKFNNNDGMLVSVAYKVTENGTLKLQHGNSDTKHLEGEQSQIGYDHKLSKNVMVFGFYTAETQKAENKDKNYLGAGVEVKF